MELFDGLEAEPAAVRLREAAARGTLSHALLLTGDSPSGGETPALARFAAAAWECRGKENRPCGVCPDCRKILKGIHPDVITVRDDEHKTIAANVIRSVRADAWIRPNEGTRKVYIFPDCSLLTERDQNILLKLVEEGPPYAAFLFCAENSAAVLPTLRSRCAELRLSPEAGPVSGPASAPRDDGAKIFDGGPEAEAVSADTGAELCRRIVKRHGSVAELAARLEKKRVTRETLARILYHGYQTLASALLLLYGRPPEQAYGETAYDLARNLTARQIMRAADIFKKYYGECVWQTGPNHVLGALASELEEIR